jgi:23S rRNA (cytosine1962-C5)-methyltransferase
VARVEGAPAPGHTVLVRGADGTQLGWAAYSPASQIRARMWTFAADDTVDDSFVAARVAAAAARRSLLLSSGLPDSARLVFSEADGVPGLIADRYGDTVVCQLTTAGRAWRECWPMRCSPAAWRACTSAAMPASEA